MKQQVMEPEKSAAELITVPANPAVILTDQGEREKLFDIVRRAIELAKPDTSTAKGRDAIKALAFKVTRTKTAIDEAGKELNAAKRAEINAVDAVRREARLVLEDLAERARQPLTDWERAEEIRIEECQAIIDGFRHAVVISSTDTAETVDARGRAIHDTEIDQARFGPALFPLAVQAKADAVASLVAAKQRLRQMEADAAELERLRAEKAKRDEEDARADAEAKAEAEKKRAAEEREAAIKRAADEAAAAERAKVEAEKAAELKKAQDEAAALKRQAEAREQAAQAEAAETARREANARHRSNVLGGIASRLISLFPDLPAPVARAITRAIAEGSVPNLKVEF
jgi:colicin import membrane protein